MSFVNQMTEMRNKMEKILYFDICALIIILVFLLSMLLREQLVNRTNKLMFLIVVLMFFSTIGDIGSAILEDYVSPSASARIISYTLNYVYFFAHNLLLPVYVHYIYSSMEIWHKYKTQMRFTRLLWFALVSFDVLVLLTNIVSGKVFTINDKLEYVRGPYIIVFYVVAAFFAIWGVELVVHYRQFINRDKAVVLVIIFPMVFGSIFIQLAHDGLLIEMFSLSVSLLFFMIAVKREESLLDPVTGALKYGAGLNRIRKVFITNKPVILVFVKITNYNNIRLYVGPRSFNTYLKTITDTMRSAAKSNKYSSDVFYLENGIFAYMSEDSTLESAKQAANEVAQFLKNTCDIDGFEVTSEARVCVIRCPEDIDDYTTLFTVATMFHEILPDTKEVILYSEYCDDDDFKMRAEMEGIINRALEENRFEVYYQPIYSTETGRYVSAEALLRLNDEKYGYVSPGVFLPVAEVTGKIHAIGDYVIDEVLKFIASENIEELGLEYIEVNLSASQCIESDLVDKIVNKLSEYGVKPQKLSLELTETSADMDPVVVDMNVNKLHAAGVRFALDDYGIGYSNIKRVTALPIEQVKLDKSFADNIDNPQMWIVVQDTISMLKEMGKEVLVEGVERESVARRLIEVDTDLFQGCGLIQGFYFCRPLQKAMFIDFIKEHNLKANDRNE